MTRFLAVLLWPAGIAVIAVIGALLARRAARAVPATAETRPPGNSPPAGRHGATAGTRDLRLRLAATNIARLGVFVFIGAAAVYAVMAALGTLVVQAGPAIDKLVYTWTLAHRMAPWAHVMDRLTKVGNTWTTWGAVAAAAVCLAVSWRGWRWLPPAVLAASVLVDHYVTLAIRHTFHRIGPPGSPGGTFPSGGVDRVILLYGLIAYLLWREFSGRRRTAIWAGAAVAALAFNEGYSRGYLTLHWFSDILSGLLYGSLLLAVFIVAVRFVMGPPALPSGEPVRAHDPGAGRGTTSSSLRAPA